MKPFSAQLLNFIVSQQDARKVLDGILNANPDHASVYYVLPLYNLKKMLRSGGICSRNDMGESFVDLSGHNIQSRRERQVSLWRDVQNASRFEVHDCVSFFLNPLNDTFFHFRRNAKVRADEVHTNEVDTTLCILELGLEGILNIEDLHWGISDQNIATRNARTTSRLDEYSRFRWDLIYSLRQKQRGIQNDQHSRYRYCSAEFIVHIEKPQEERYIPTNLIRRILTLDGDQDKVQLYLEVHPRLISAVNQDTTFSVFDDALYWDKRFLWNLQNLSARFKIPLSCFCSAVNQLARAKTMIGLNLVESYPNSSLANGYHGVSHTIRVMFWVLFLAEMLRALGEAISDEEIRASLFAAFVHDLERIDHSEEKNHGEVAANKYQRFVSEHISIQKAESCLNAVRFHCTDARPLKPDIVWKLLKDADALDRGRYGPPNRQSGCQLSMLKLDIFGNRGLAEACGWMAYWLSTITKFANCMENDPYFEFRLSLLNSFRALDRDDTLTKWLREGVTYLIQHLQTA